MNDVQQAFTQFHQTYICLHDGCFPVKTVKVGYRKKIVVNTRFEEVNENKTFFVKSLKYPTVTNINNYKEYKHLFYGRMKQGEK